MSDLFGNHIVGFPTRRLKFSGRVLHPTDSTAKVIWRQDFGVIIFYLKEGQSLECV